MLGVPRRKGPDFLCRYTLGHLQGCGPAMRCGVLPEEGVMLADGHDPDNWDTIKAGMIAALSISQLSGLRPSASMNRFRDSGCLVGDCRGHEMKELRPRYRTVKGGRSRHAHCMRVWHRHNSWLYQGLLHLCIAMLHLPDGVVRLDIAGQVDQQVSQPGPRNAQAHIRAVASQRRQRVRAGKAQHRCAAVLAQPSQDLHTRTG